MGTRGAGNAALAFGGAVDKGWRLINQALPDRDFWVARHRVNPCRDSKLPGVPLARYQRRPVGRFGRPAHDTYILSAAAPAFEDAREQPVRQTACPPQGPRPACHRAGHGRDPGNLRSLREQHDGVFRGGSADHSRNDGALAARHGARLALSRGGAQEDRRRLRLRRPLPRAFGLSLHHRGFGLCRRRLPRPRRRQ